MTSSYKVIKFPTSTSGDYCKAYNTAAYVLINSLIRKGRKFISLDELYDTLSANTDYEKNGILWGVRDAKKKGLITSTQTRGYYQNNGTL